MADPRASGLLLGTQESSTRLLSDSCPMGTGADGYLGRDSDFKLLAAAAVGVNPDWLPLRPCSPGHFKSDVGRM